MIYKLALHLVKAAGELLIRPGVTAAGSYLLVSRASVTASPSTGFCSYLGLGCVCVGDICESCKCSDCRMLMFINTLLAVLMPAGLEAGLGCVPLGDISESCKCCDWHILMFMHLRIGCDTLLPCRLGTTWVWRACPWATSETAAIAVTSIIDVHQRIEMTLNGRSPTHWL
jgi:hypothetical protein